MRRIHAGVLVVVAAFEAACSTAKDEVPIGKSRAPLELQVSAPFYVEAFPKVSDALAQGRIEFGCGASGCLVIYSESPGGHDSILASRVSPAGALLDVPRILLDQPADGYTIARAVVAHGSEYLVVWTAGGFSTPIRSRAVRISATNGSVLGDVTAAFPGEVDAVWTTGSTYLVSYLDAQRKSHAVVLDAATFKPVGPPIDLPLGAPRAVASPGQYLLTWKGNAQRLDETTGAFIDGAPIEFSRYITGDFTGVFQGGTYQLAVLPDSGATTSIYGSRIKADGTVLDADDTFNQIPGPKLLCSACAEAGTGPVGVHIVGSDVVVTWMKQNDTFAARVNPATGQRTTGTTAAAEVDLGLFPMTFEMLSQTNGIGLTTNTISTITATPAGADASSFKLTSTFTHSIGLAAKDRVHPVVAGNGSLYLVAWFSDGHLYATRVNGTTGAYLDDPPLDLGIPDTATSPAPPFVAASLGPDFMVLWRKGNVTVANRIVRANGTVDPLESFSPPLPVGAYISSVRVVSNGKYYFVAWCKVTVTSTITMTVEGMRMAADGTPVDSTPVELGTGVGAQDFSLAADTVPAAAQRTFVAAWQTQAGGSELRLVRSELGVLINPTQLVAVGGDPLMATDGSHVLVLGDAGKATLLDPAPGTLDPVATLPALAVKQGYLPHRVVFDGKSYVVGAMNNGAFVNRYSPTLVPLDAALPHGTEVVDRLDESSFDMASNGAGRSLFVYSNADVARAGFAVTARFIDNDGLPTPMPPDAGSADSGDASSSTGGATNGGATSSGGTSSGGTSPDATTSPSGGTTSSGGSPSTGGGPTGGTSSGGAPAGGTGSGGAPTGGTSGAAGGGGAPTGGATSTGGRSGSSGTGGKRAATGGANSSDTGGFVNVSGDVLPGKRDDSGCGCAVPGRSSNGNWWAVALAAGALVQRRRRRA